MPHLDGEAAAVFFLVARRDRRDEGTAASGLAPLDDDVAPTGEELLTVDIRKTEATSRMQEAGVSAAGSQATAVLRPLSRRRSEAVLARNSVGRIAFAHRGHVNIAPMLYVFIDGWLYARADAALRIAIRHNRWVAVEVAEVEGVSEWRSVVARGACYSTTDRGSTADDALAAGIEHLRNRIPEMSHSGRGAPFRTAIYRVHVDELTGYAARPSRRRTAGAAAKRRATAAADQARADDDGMTQAGADDRR